MGCVRVAASRHVAVPPRDVTPRCKHVGVGERPSRRGVLAVVQRVILCYSRGEESFQGVRQYPSHHKERRGRSIRESPLSRPAIPSPSDRSDLLRARRDVAGSARDQLKACYQLKNSVWSGVVALLQPLRN